MTYTLQILPQQHTMLGIWHPTFDFHNNIFEFNSAVHKLLEKREKPLLLFVVAEDEQFALDEVVLKVNLMNQVQGSIFQHPKIIQTTFISPNQAIRMDKHGISLLKDDSEKHLIRSMQLYVSSIYRLREYQGKRQSA